MIDYVERMHSDLIRISPGQTIQRFSARRIAATRENTPSILCILAHKLKPAFPMVGLSWLEADFQKLETEAKAGANEQDIELIINQIEEKIAKGIPLVKAEMERLRQ